MKKLVFWLATALVSLQQLAATPNQVIIIRHGEKPSDPSEPGLNLQGLERSGALSFFFQNDSLTLDFGLPAAIYTYPSTEKTHRGVQTITPTAEALGLSVQFPYEAQDVADLAHLILNDPMLEGRMALICWDHNYIPGLVEALGGPVTPNYPNNRFDLVYKLTYSDGSESTPVLCIGLENLMQNDPTTAPVEFNPYACLNH